MTDIVLFHHAQGLTEGVHAFADRLRAGGHRVFVPDYYDGATFDDLDAGVAHAQGIGMDVIVARAIAAADREDVPAAAVYAGFSLGAMPAQKLAQTRPGALGALLYHGGLPPEVFGTPWPPSVPLQVHVAEGDPWVEDDEVRPLVAAAGKRAELFVYPGTGHLVTDASLPAYEPATTTLIVSRSLELLDRVG